MAVFPASSARRSLVALEFSITALVAKEFFLALMRFIFQNQNHEVHDMEFLTQEFVRTISSLRKSLLPLHRPSQLGAGNQRFRERGR